jgi:hypothetical protein
MLPDIAVDPSGHIWVGAQCGKIWTKSPLAALWTEFQTQTGTHILGISFLPSSSTGYFGGTYNGGPKKPSHSIVQYKP